MPVIKMTHVISYSSQDDRYPVTNILTPSASSGSSNDGQQRRSASSTSTKSRPWLISPDDAMSGQMQAEFQLEKSSTITHVDIGNSGSSIVELMVSRSCWTMDKYVTFLPAFSFSSLSSSSAKRHLAASASTPTSSQSTRSSSCGDNDVVGSLDNGKKYVDADSSSVRMFSTEDFVKDAAKMKWDRVRVTCRRPAFFFDRRRPDSKQFGLSFVILKDTSTANGMLDMDHDDDDLILPPSPMFSSSSRGEASKRAATHHQNQQQVRDRLSSTPTSEPSFRQIKMSSGLRVRSKLNMVDDHVSRGAAIDPLETRSAALVRLARAKQPSAVKHNLQPASSRTQRERDIPNDTRRDVEEEQASTSNANSSSNAKRFKPAEVEVLEDEVTIIEKLPDPPVISGSNNQCPICFVYFTAEAIENHVEECLANDDDVIPPSNLNLDNTLPDIEVRPSTSRVPEGHVLCPLCNQVFSDIEIQMHASECCLI